MNNNFFNPNLMRSIPYTNVIGNTTSTLPRGGILSSLFGGTRGATMAGASRITFSGILNGASKTLGVINQAIPVFYQVKPVFNNAKTMFRVAKEINKTNHETSSTNEKRTQKKEEHKNGPTFFL